MLRHILILIKFGISVHGKLLSDIKFHIDQHDDSCT